MSNSKSDTNSVNDESNELKTELFIPAVLGNNDPNPHQKRDISEQRTVDMGVESTTSRHTLNLFDSDKFPLVDEERYRIERILGEGGMGRVYSVYDAILGRHLAMKEMSSEMLGNQNFEYRFIKEAQVMGSLQHPSIISVHDIGKNKEGNIVFLMDQVEGETMEVHIGHLHKNSSPMEWAQGEEWSLRRIIEAYYRICETMAYVHDKNIVHLDLKPTNVQFGHRGEVWILDWGLARTADVSDASVWCSPNYTSPERAQGRQIAACDVYALGAILFEILVGNPPFSECSNETIFHLLSLNKIPTVSEAKAHQRPIPKVLLELCEQAMHADPEQRITSETLARLVREWLDGTLKKTQALEIVGEAIRTKQVAEELQLHSLDAMENMRILADNLPEGHSLESKFPLWDLEQEASNASKRSAQLFEEYILLLRRAIFIFPNTLEALIPLIEHCIEKHQLAYKSKNLSQVKVLEAETRSYLELIPEQHPIYQKAKHYFEGESQVELHLSVPANIILEVFEPSRKRLHPKVLEIIKNTSTVSRKLPIGSYRLRILSSKHAEVHYPFFLEHGQDWCQSPSSDEKGEALPLPTKAELEDHCYIPQGWFYASGDADAPNSLAEERVWADGFIISRTPITHRQYLQFLNHLMDEGAAEQAMLWVPREQSSREGEKGAPVYLLEDNRFHHPKGGAYDNYPVVQVSWYCAVAYTQWLSKQTGLKWRLPMELEWEKAARGVDRRYFPWGDLFDSNFCVMMDSHVGTPEIKNVYFQPLDVSVYGVLSCSGNTREWCLDRFSLEQLPIENGRIQYPTQSDLESPDFRSSRGGSYGNAATRTRSADRDWWFPELSYIGRGFRIARSWLANPMADALYERIEVAHKAHLKSI